MVRAFALLAAGSALAIASCTSTPDPDAPTREDEVAAKIAARQGDRVDRICFTQSINSWSPLGDDAVILRRSVSDYYQLDLGGVCDVDWATFRIGIRSRGSSCLRRGDKIQTFDGPFAGSCLITAIYEWDNDAPITDAARAAGEAETQNGTETAANAAALGEAD